MWHYCTGVPAEKAYLTSALYNAGIRGINVNMTGEELRPEYVYVNLASINDTYFEEKLGLDLLRLPRSTTSKSTKRSLDATLPGFSFGSKKRKSA